jgi:hypothetical protein
MNKRQKNERKVKKNEGNRKNRIEEPGNIWYNELCAEAGRQISAFVFVQICVCTRSLPGDRAFIFFITINNTGERKNGQKQTDRKPGN